MWNSLCVRLLNRLRLSFSHLNKHRFKHNSTNTFNPLCLCTLETEDTGQYFLRCQNNLSFRTTLMNELNNNNIAISSLDSNDLLRIILYGNKSRDKSFDKKTNYKMLTAKKNTNFVRVIFSKFLQTS